MASGHNMTQARARERRCRSVEERRKRHVNHRAVLSVQEDFNVSGKREIEVAGKVPAGPSVIEVRAEDRPDGLMPHDINLFRLEEGVGLPEIVEWMDWMEPEGFRAPAPGRSLGGMEHLSPDRAGYVHLDLEPRSDRIQHQRVLRSHVDLAGVRSVT